MFLAKERGGGRHAVFDEGLRHGLLRRLDMEPALLRAVSGHEFVAHFQPQVSLATGRICGAEALVRWNRPGHDLVPPLEFIDAAERIGVIADVDLWVFTEACRLIAAWRAAGLVDGGFTLASNLSALSLGREDLPERLHRILRETAADPRNLSLEITETVLMADAPDTARRVQALKELGLQLAIDDFGTGYSSLAYLRRFPVDMLKIDRTFVHGVADDAQDRAIAGAVIALAGTLGLRSVAEGVETGEQLLALRALGCTEAQGHYFGAAMPAQTLEELLGRTWPEVSGGG
jgi:diguanylate cyclase